MAEGDQSFFASFCSQKEASLALAFDAALNRLGPFGAKPFLCVAASGGADSTALALLAERWVEARQGRLLAIIVDHGLRPAAAAEAALTQNRLAARGIAAEIVTLSVARGPAMQERARAARHEALLQAARRAGSLFVLLGHHARDQAETVAMRAARGPGGMEGMASWAARDDAILLRPLLGIQPEVLRDYLRAQNMEWVEDSSNADPRFERVRLRTAGQGLDAADPTARQALEQDAAAFLARHVVLRPEGFAVVRAATLPEAALSALLRVVGAADYPPPRAAVAALAPALRPASLGGVHILPAGKFGPGWLLVREPAACAPPVAASPGALWDRRFRLKAATEPGARFGALGTAASSFRAQSDLPAVVLRGMPCLRQDGKISFPVACAFAPPAPVTSHPFSP